MLFDARKLFPDLCQNSVKFQTFSVNKLLVCLYDVNNTEIFLMSHCDSMGHRMNQYQSNHSLRYRAGPKISLVPYLSI